MLGLALLSLGYQLGPARPVGSSCRAAAATMQETYRLNNYVLPGPVKCVGDQVLVKMAKKDDRTTGGLFVAAGEGDAAAPKQGTVVACGPGKAHPDTGVVLPMPASVGDLVLLADFTGEKVSYCS